MSFADSLFTCFRCKIGEKNRNTISTPKIGCAGTRTELRAAVSSKDGKMMARAAAEKYLSDKWETTDLRVWKSDRLNSDYAHRLLLQAEINSEDE